MQRARESSGLFLNSLETRYPRKAVFIGIIIFLISFTMFTSLTSNAFINGDAAVYEQQMAHLDFSQRTIHLVYYLYGAMFTWLLPGSNE